MYMTPVMFSDPDGKFAITAIVVLLIGSYMLYGMTKAHETARELGYNGWELAGYRASGIIAGDYFVVKDNWDSISSNIVPDYNGERINFNFTSNKYYSIFTAGLYAKHLNNNYFVSGRTTLGMYLELQAHYIFDKVARPFGITNGNPAWMGSPDLDDDWTAWIFESLAEGIRRSIQPRIPRLYP